MKTQEQFDMLLEHVRRTRGTDLSGYKRAGLMRRVMRRMQLNGMDSFASYIDHLEVHPEEYGRLFDALLINVTSFFRDPVVWEFLRETIVPRMLEARGPHEPIRLWSAGCAAGMEAFSLAMTLAEAMGVEQFRERVKIYATDVDDDALTQGRHAAYSSREVEPVPKDLLEKYFEPQGEKHVFSKELRRAVIFGRHDLLADAPISRIDLLLNRNTLMYFNAEAQTRILTRLHFALGDDSYLVLGKAETLLTQSALFTPVDLRRRVFRRVPRPNLRDRLAAMTPGPYEAGSDGDPAAPGADRTGTQRLSELAFDSGPVAQIVVAAQGSLVAANDRARTLFNLTPRDVGRPLQDLELSYRPVELRSLIQQASAERRVASVKDIRWIAPGGERAQFDVEVVPLFEQGGAVAGTAAIFTDVTRHRRLQDELQQSHEELEAAYEELQSTSEELETTNEELQSTVEELETTNEELQSTNEELETMNEELQSTNEELHSINDELRQRSEELDCVNSFLESILASLRGGVAVVDRDLRIRAWNAEAEELWGLRKEEVQGKDFASLDIGLPVRELLATVHGCIGGSDGEVPRAFEAVNRRGRAIQCRVSCWPLREAGSDEIRGAILLMSEVDSTE